MTFKGTMERAKGPKAMEMEFSFISKRKSVSTAEPLSLHQRSFLEGTHISFLFFPRQSVWGGRDSSEKLEAGLLSVMLFKDEV